MKRLLIGIVTICCAMPAAFAQSKASSFDVDGIKVILKPTVKDVINVRMFFRGGVSNYTAAQAGIESFALEATVQCGTQKYSGNAYRDSTDAYDIDIGTEADYDYADIEMDCVSKYFDQGWNLFANAIVKPAFDAGEVELLRNKLLAKVRQEQSDPDSRSTQLILDNAFQGTPYATDPQGTDETISKFTADDLRAYYKRILNKNQLFIVVAGNISKEELMARIHASFAALPSMPYEKVTYKQPIWNDNKILTDYQRLSTNYVNAIMNAPPMSSPDYMPFRLGISVLSGGLFNALRTRLNLSYNPGALTQMREMPYALMFVSTDDPSAAVPQMIQQLHLAKTYGLKGADLRHLKGSYITDNYIKQQSSSAITGSLGEAEVLDSWETEEKLPELVKKVTIDQINVALNQYIVGLRWSYLGNEQPEKDAETSGAYTDVK